MKIAIAFLLIGMSLFGSASVGDIERDNNGNILRLAHEYAIEHCRDKGARLPTPREYAELGEKLWAVGISETMKEGYKLIRGLDSEDKPDHFYYNNRGYWCPKEDGDICNNWFWTSMIYPKASLSTIIFNGSDGYLDNGYRYYSSRRAFRCVVAH